MEKGGGGERGGRNCAAACGLCWRSCNNCLSKRGQRVQYGVSFKRRYVTHKRGFFCCDCG